MLKLLKMGLIEFIVWSYITICLKFVIFDKMICTPDFFSQKLDLHFAQTLPWIIFSLVISLAFLYSKSSIGKWALGEIKAHNAKFQKAVILFLVLISFISGYYFTEINLTEFFSEQGISNASRIFGALLHPNLEIIGPAVTAAIETIYMAFMATALALPFAFIIGFFAARNLMSETFILRAVYNITRFFLNISRSIEPLVWAIIFSIWVGIGPFSGMLALCLHSVASLSKLYSEQIENINEGPIEAMKATGAHPVQVIWFGVVPQIVLPYLSFTIYRWDINVRMATVIGLVGGGGIGTMLMQYQGLAKWNEVGLLVAIIAIIVWAMDYTSSKIREAIK